MILADRDHRYAIGFQYFQGLGQIEDRLGPGRNHANRRFRQLQQIGRDVEAGFSAAMHAADAAGGEHRDARQAGADQRRGHRGRAVQALTQRHCQIGPRELARVLNCNQPIQFGGAQTNVDLPVQHRDRGGRGAACAHRFFQRQRCFAILRSRQTMSDDG